MKGFYTLTEMTKSFIEEYKLDRSSENYIRQYNMKLKRTIKELDIKGTEMKNPVTKRKATYYTEKEKQTILASKYMYDYLIEHSMSDKIKKRPKYDEIKEIIRNRMSNFYNVMLSEREDHSRNDGDPFISNAEFSNFKLFMMVQALFERTFTPIKDDLLLSDMENYFIKRNEGQLTPEDIAVEDRLNHPEGNYFHHRRNYDTKTFKRDEEK